MLASEGMERPMSLEADRLCKKTKVLTRKGKEPTVAREPTSQSGGEPKECPRGASQGEGAEGSARARECVRPRAVSVKSTRSVSMWDLCSTWACAKDEPDWEATARLEPRWSRLTLGNRIWTDGSSSSVNLQGALILAMAKQLYSSLSEVLIENASKSLV